MPVSDIENRSVADDFSRLGYRDVRVLADEDGDTRGIEATYGRR